ncbi:MAG TPA: endonuclease III [Syntrophorhabdaceae bacterium]|nr:endonuclease III [Syntrophorhabdaceae bacterium]
MKKEHTLFTEIVETLKDYLKDKVPVITELSQKKDVDPFVILIGTILSLRTKDETTRKAMERLFKRARTPEEMLMFKNEALEQLIYPVGFYKKKAKTIKDISKTIIERYNGKVPDELEELLKIKGVGRKTANLVITEGFSKPGICVDTHVHRISNRLGVIKTKNPHETEYALRDTLPEKYWNIYNALLVTFGQYVCKPISPHCSLCPLGHICKRIGVRVFR